MPITKGTARDLALMSRGSYGAGGDVQDDHIHDTLLFPAIPGDMNFLTIPIGGTFGAGTKTRVETSLLDPGKLPAGQSFLVKKLKISLILLGRDADTSAFQRVRDFYVVMKYSHWTINIAGKDFEWEAPGDYILPMISEVGIASAANPNRVGDYNSHSWYNIKTPITFGELVSFNIKAQIGSGLPAITTVLTAALAALHDATAAIRVTLRGTLTRSK